MTVRLQREDFDIGAEIARLTAGRTDVGAVATFTGICRGTEGVSAMTLEHYPGMAEAEIERHVAQAQSRWPLLGVTVIHRFGRFSPGENIVLVVATSSHREAAFAAAEFLMDYLKVNAPFWKKEERAGGDGWVEARDTDAVAAHRWAAGASKQNERKPEAAE
jgi:molybdopterin synthase catalytic subunit